MRGRKKETGKKTLKAYYGQIHRIHQLTLTTTRARGYTESLESLKSSHLYSNGNNIQRLLTPLFVSRGRIQCSSKALWISLTGAVVLFGKMVAHGILEILLMENISLIESEYEMKICACILKD